MLKETQESRDIEVAIRVNNADFDKEVAYELFDDLFKDEIYDYLEDKYRDDLKQQWIDGMDNKEFFAGLVMEDINVRNRWRIELEEKVLEWMD